MRLLGRMMLATGAVLACGGAALAAERAAQPAPAVQAVQFVPVHLLSVRLPDGSIRRVRYLGDTPPRVVLVARPVAPADPFLAMDRMMDRMMAQANAMLARAAAMQRAGASGQGISVHAAPGGVVRYTSVTTSGGSGTCTRSVQMTSFGANQPPKVVSQSSGDCTKVNAPVVTTVAPAARPAPRVVPAIAPKPAPKEVARDTI